MAVPYSPSLPTRTRRSRPKLRTLAVDLAVGAAAVAVFLAPGRMHHAQAAPVTEFGGTVAAPVAVAPAPKAQPASHVHYVMKRIPCAAGEGQLACWTTVPAT